MKDYTFYRESNNFDDILSDTSIKKHIRIKLSWKYHLRIGFDDQDEKLETYIKLKYGDELKNNGLVPDRTPEPFKDYQPKKPQWYK